MPAALTLPELRRLAVRHLFRERLSAEHLRLHRLFFFTVVGVDAWLRLPYVMRGGVCGFNVAHFEWVTRWFPVPTPGAWVLLQVLQVVLAFRMALGAGGRWTAAALASAFGVSYFWSVADTWAHHYLAFLLLVLTVFVDWHDARRSQWALRLSLLQYAVVYFWAAWTKFQPYWASGFQLMEQIPPETRNVMAEVTQALGIDLVNAWKVVAWGVVVFELTMPVAMQFKRARPYTSVAGLGFHGFIEIQGLFIGRFAWFMFALHVMNMPGRWGTALGRLLWPKRVAAWADGWRGSAQRWVGMVLVGVAVGAALPFDEMGWVLVAMVLGSVLDARALRWRASAGLATAVACALPMALHSATTVALESHVLVARGEAHCGSQARAVRHYEQALAISAPEGGGLLVELGDVHARGGRTQDAVFAYQRARERGVAPDVVEARIATVTGAKWRVKVVP